MSRQKAIIYLAITATLWSFSGVSIKLIEWNPVALASARSLLAGLTVLFLISRRQPLDFKTHWPAKLLTAACLTGLSFSFVAATKLTTAANAILLQYTAPVWVALLSPWLLGERVRGRDWFFMLLIFAGMCFFFKGQLSSRGLTGNILGVVCGLCFGLLAIAVKNCHLKGQSSVEAIIAGNMITFLAGLYFWRPPWPDPLSLALLAAAGIFQMGLAYFFYTQASASASVSALDIVIITTIEPVINPVWVWLITGERPGAWAIWGGLAIMASVTAWSVVKTRPFWRVSSEKLP